MIKKGCRRWFLLSLQKLQELEKELAKELPRFSPEFHARRKC